MKRLGEGIEKKFQEKKVAEKFGKYSSKVDGTINKLHKKFTGKGKEKQNTETEGKEKENEPVEDKGVPSTPEEK